MDQLSVNKRLLAVVIGTVTVVISCTLSILAIWARSGGEAPKELEKFFGSQSSFIILLRGDIQVPLPYGKPFDIDNRIQAVAQRHETDIPNIVHFVFGLKGYDPFFGFLEYCAVASALNVLNPERVLFHYRHEPQGYFWELVRPHVELHRVRNVDNVHGRPVHHYAHKADIIRLEALLEHGGIYLDTDAIVLRPFSHLMTEQMVMGEEGEGGRWGLCNAIMLAAPNATFLHRWYAQYAQFNSTIWNHFSVVMPANLSVMYPHDIQVLPDDAFFRPLWYPWDLSVMMSTYHYGYEKGLAVHMWNTAIQKQRLLDGFSMHWTFQPRSTLLSMLRAYVPPKIFSIITYCDRRGPGILLSINSALQQTFSRMEVVVVGDNSTRSQACMQYAQKQFSTSHDLSRVKFVRSFGMANRLASIERGIRSSSGHWIIPLIAGHSVLSADVLLEAQRQISAHPTTAIMKVRTHKVPAASWISAARMQIRFFRHFLGYVGEDDSVSDDLLVIRKSQWNRMVGYTVGLQPGLESFEFGLRSSQFGALTAQLPSGAFIALVEEGPLHTTHRRAVEHAMVRLMHPRLQHPAATIEDHKLVEVMGSETQIYLEQSLARNDVSTDFRLFTFLWLLIASVGCNAIAEARVHLAVLNVQLGGKQPPVEIGWQIELYKGKLECSLGNYNLGKAALNGAIAIEPTLSSVDTVQLLLADCFINSTDVAQ